MDNFCTVTQGIITSDLVYPVLKSEEMFRVNIAKQESVVPLHIQHVILLLILE